ncbi:hypothetical protein AZE42_07563 [Rhizopogon vesiculosus]|uniref:Uncharacterized protein n=1 Tax=Rhizopogon vesiculosus TaxID=180088 RepID=A0A1J8Q582_9AGAM|nr:hypothetical protein AZE42_07563 [Rhizopogon vesiculosus]
MDDLSCLGCGKDFTTQKRLSGHEASCDANKRFDTAVYKRQRRLEKDRRKKDEPKRQRVRKDTPSPERSTKNATSLPDADVQMDIDNDLYSDIVYEPGPSGSNAVPVVPTPDAPPAIDLETPAREERAHSPPTTNVGDQPIVAPYQTDPDAMGLFRIYSTCPTLIPSGDVGLDAIADAPTIVMQGSPDLERSRVVPGLPNTDIQPEDIFSAFSSLTAGLLMSWQYSGTNAKSAAELSRLATYIDDPLFNKEDARGLSHTREKKLLDDFLKDRSNPFRTEHGWRQSSVEIRLPKEKVKWDSEEDAPVLEIPGVYHRSITDIITSVFEDTVSSSFHMTPFRQLWKVSEERTVNVFSEAYSSPAFVEAHAEVNALPRDPDDNLERVVASLMMWSDATHLTNFGDASLWPFYLFFGNQSKYTRGKPTASACHHVAYIPTLPDDFQDIYINIFGGASSADVYTHCKRELIQAIWRLLLDEDFMHAYKHGIIIRCGDGVTRRVFPRFSSYSADYPEKILLACIKFLGACPCPRCLVEKQNIPKMGTKLDMKHRERTRRADDERRRRHVEQARRLIFKEGAGINSEYVKRILNEESLVPTRNAFSDRLAEFLFNFFLLFVVDLLHEFELGVWKAIFTHLMRILVAAGGIAVQELNWRYRKVPTFGRGTIRRFHKNASAMKRLATRDFEDLLQCAIPVFEGLLPNPHNKVILDLLFDLVT